MKTKLLALLAILGLLMGGPLAAQKGTAEWQLGYFAPYFTHVGGNVGYAWPIMQREAEKANKSNRNHQLQLVSQLAYFVQFKVSHNIFLNPELSYRWGKLNKRLYLSAGIGTGYLLSFQRQEGTLNLGTGDIKYKNEALHLFVPNVNAGFGVLPRKTIGYYLKATYGRELGRSASNAGLVGLSTGIIIRLNAKT